ncbi:MAG TPA: aminotransferase class I/II-fold pyridoxal phosphate-dependent enzyme [Candidatus Acidoferrum sp.]|nr:aminotransferase class I/II-fold pyridoxal phosphate-dependent enzyme [Candidatus Acidoferrum sp.]
MLAEPLQQVDRTYVLHRGRKLSYFGGCDYFRLASHPKVMRALRVGAEKFGLNVAASRSTTGNHVLYGQLESALAKFFRVDAALVFSNGYVTNYGVCQSLAGEFTHVLIDARSHSSVSDAARFLDCPNATFHHRDANDLAAKVRRLNSRAKLLVITDGMYSHDGSVAPLREYLRVLPRSAMLLVDDAHGAGVLGAQGGGAIEHGGVGRQRVIQTIALSKAFGCYGGAVLCSRKLRDRIIERSRLFNGNTPLPLPFANAALASVQLLEKHPQWRERMNANAAWVKGALRSAGREIPDHPGPIISITPRDGAEAKRLSTRLLKHAVFPSLIRYADSDGHFRFMISSEHTRAQLNAMVAALNSDRAPLSVHSLGDATAKRSLSVLPKQA